jgi:hypothetical protein
MVGVFILYKKVRDTMSNGIKYIITLAIISLLVVGVSAENIRVKVDTNSDKTIDVNEDIKTDDNAVIRPQITQKIERDNVIAPKSSDVNKMSMKLTKNELQWSKKQISFSVIKSASDTTDFTKIMFSDPDTHTKYVQSEHSKSNTVSFKDRKSDNVQMKMTDITLTDEQFSRPEFVKKQWAVMYQTDDGIFTVIRGNTE